MHNRVDGLNVKLTGDPIARVGVISAVTMSFQAHFSLAILPRLLLESLKCLQEAIVAVIVHTMKALR
jgi:hypothetical protein